MKSLSTGVLVFAVLATLFLAVQPQVIGIDFGTEFWKAGLITPGKTFTILENSKSERKTPNAISFADEQRLFEDEAGSKYPRFPKQTFVDLNKYLPLLDDENAELPTDYKARRENGTIIFELPNEKEASLEQLLAMNFKYIRSLGMIQLATDNLQDCVLSVPSGWGLRARTALINAAKIARLNVFSVLNDNSAAALHYSISRPETDSINVVIFNMGSATLQVSVVNFYGELDSNKNKTVNALRVLSHASADVGGYAIDNKIATLVADKFNARHKKNVQGNFRSWARVLQKASGVKETLSANKDATVYIENLIDGLDLQQTILRSEYETDPIFDQVLAPIQQALKQAGLDKTQISSVQMIGGASRVPKIVSKLTEYFAPVEVGTHINGDEAVALGAVVHAANLSGSFRIKDIRYYEQFGHEIRAQVLNSDDNSTIFNQVVFEKESNPYQFRGVELNETEHDITINLYRQGELFRTYTSLGVGLWKSIVMKGQEPTRPVPLRLLFALTPVGLAEITTSYMPIYKNESYTRQVPSFEEVQVPETETEDAKKQEGKEADGKDGSNSTENNSTQGEGSPKKPRTIKKYVKKNVTYWEERLVEHKVPLLLTQHKYEIFNSTVLKKQEQLLLDYEGIEREIRNKAQAKNELESLLYEIREKLEIITPYANQSTLEKLQSLVEAKLLWLEDNSYTASTSEFRVNLIEVKSVYDPIVERVALDESIQIQYDKGVKFLRNLADKTEQLTSTHPWVADKAEELLKNIESIIAKFTQLLNQQKAQPKDQEPIFKIDEMSKESEAAKQSYYRLKTTPRPKPQKPAKSEEVRTQKQDNANKDEETDL